MDMVETTKQFPPPVNILNNSERNLRLAFYPCTSHLKYVYICFQYNSIKTMQQFSQVINLFSQIIEWKSYCDLGKFLYAACLKIHVKQGHLSYIRNHNFTLWHLYDSPPHNSHSVRVQETFLAPDEQLFRWTFSLQIWKLSFNDFSVPIRNNVQKRT